MGRKRHPYANSIMRHADLYIENGTIIKDIIGGKEYYTSEEIELKKKNKENIIIEENRIIVCYLNNSVRIKLKQSLELLRKYGIILIDTSVFIK